LVQGIRVAKWCGIRREQGEKGNKKKQFWRTVLNPIFLEIFPRKWCVSMLIGGALQRLYTNIGNENEGALSV